MIVKIIVYEDDQKKVIMEIEFVVKILNEMNMQQNLKKKLNKYNMNLDDEIIILKKKRKDEEEIVKEG